MNCADFEARAHEELDVTRVPQAADLAEHAAQCATCRATWEGFRLLSECIGVWRHETPEADLAAAVVFALGQSTDPTPAKSQLESWRSTVLKQSGRPRSVALAIAGAAAVLIALALLPVLRPNAQSTTPVAQAPALNRAVKPEVKRAVQRDLAVSNADRTDGALSDEIGSNAKGGSTPQAARQHPAQPETDRVPYYDLAQRASGALGQMTMLVSPGDRTPQSPAQEPATGGPASWMDDFQLQLKPVGRSLGNAFDFLWQAGESVGG